MRIGQALGNLLTDTVNCGDEEHDILVRLDHRDGEIEISVTNPGWGVLPAELPHLFDRVACAKPTRGSGVPGMGPGLYILKGVVEAHGGRPLADSVPGKTTSFHLSLPLTAANREAA
jgi:signal transduction histidine kinase